MDDEPEITTALCSFPEPPLPPEPKTNESIDKLTLELFMNKSAYQKYVSKTNPKKYAEIQDYHENLQTYGSQILEITTDLLENPEMQITNDVNGAFEAYTKSVIRHLKQKYIEKQNRFNANDDDEYGDNEDDVLFGNIPTDRPPSVPANYPMSYWGKNTFHRKK